MSYPVTSSPMLLSDALERAYSYTILNASHPLSFGSGVKATGRALRRAAFAVGRLVAAAINAQAEVRAQNYHRLPQ
ncbi:MAG TPA: hypothetical protein VF285_01540 [Castellaniella sp.]|uniref:hypothetical protein n=1 Tax=Castellaniella sp. TaxID=1955812 RepID=UPI002EE7EE6C